MEINSLCYTPNRQYRLVHTHTFWSMDVAVNYENVFIRIDCSWIQIIDGINNLINDFKHIRDESLSEWQNFHLGDITKIAIFSVDSSNIYVSLVTYQQSLEIGSFLWIFVQAFINKIRKFATYTLMLQSWWWLSGNTFKLFEYIHRYWFGWWLICMFTENLVDKFLIRWRNWINPNGHFNERQP